MKASAYANLIPQCDDAQSLHDLQSQYYLDNEVSPHAWKFLDKLVASQAERNSMYEDHDEWHGQFPVQRGGDSLSPFPPLFVWREKLLDPLAICLAGIIIIGVIKAVSFFHHHI